MFRVYRFEFRVSVISFKAEIEALEIEAVSGFQKTLRWVSLFIILNSLLRVFIEDRDCQGG